MTIKERLDIDIYPALYTKLEEALPEFSFKSFSGGYVSTNTQKIDGTTGESIGKVYVYEDAISYLKDWTRDSLSIWDYIQQKDQLTNGETLKRLASLAGVSLPRRKLSKEELEQLAKERKRAKLLEESFSFCIDCLSHKDNDYAKTPEAVEIRRYLIEDRGFKMSEIRLPDQKFDRKEQKLEVGFLPSIAALRETLLAKGYTSEEAELVASKESLGWIGATNKLIIPWRDKVGRIVGFIGRVTDQTNDRAPKYAYSKGLKKGDYLFNLKTGQKGRELIIVEGILDAMRASLSGVKNVVAVGGADLSTLQLEAAKKSGAGILTLCLDGDKAGREATLKNIKKVKEDGDLKAYAVDLPEGEDPASLIKEEGIESFRQRIDRALSIGAYFRVYIVRKYAEIEKAGEFTAKVRDQLRGEVAGLYALLNDTTERADFKPLLDNIEDNYGVGEEAIKEEVEQIRERVKEARQLNKLKEAAELAIEDTIDGGSPTAALDNIEDRLRKIRREERAISLDDILKIQTKETIVQKLREAPESLKTGYQLTKEAELELPAGALSVFAAPTGHGKTRIAVNLALSVLEEQNAGEVYFFSYEEARESVILRALNNYADLELSASNQKSINSYYTGETEEERLKYIKFNYNEFIKKEERFYQELILSGRLSISYVNFSAEDLVEAIYQLKAKKDPIAIFIDYIQLLRLSNSGRSSRQEELKEIAELLKNCAVETGLPIVVGAQFNREVKTDKDLNALSIREAADIEHIANLIVGMFDHSAPSMVTKQKNIPDPLPYLTAKVLKWRGHSGGAGLSGFYHINQNSGKIEQRLESREVLIEDEPEKETSKSRVTKGESLF